MPFQIFGKSDVGLVRNNNEDTFGRGTSADGFELVCVADGMGGFEAGEVASLVALDATLEHWESTSGQDPRERLLGCFVRGNTAVLAEAERLGHGAAMGTTLVLLALREGQGYLAHIGDSRGYRVQGGEIERMTVDHNEAQRLVAEGELDPEEADYSDVGHILTRCLGIDDVVEPDIQGPFEIPPNDVFLLCSDGLSDMVEDPLIGEILRYYPMRESAERLIELAKWRGGFDNITLQIVRAGQGEGPLETPPAGYALEYEVSPAQRMVGLAIIVLVVVGLLWLLLR